MLKRIGVVLLMLLAGLFLVVASWGYLSYEAGGNMKGLTGNSISETVGAFYETGSINQRLVVLSQIFLLVIIVVAVFFIFKRFRKKVMLSKKNYIPISKNKRARTDLDILYEMLKRKGELDMEDVVRTFKVSPEIVLGWFKVLENGDLAEIDYPRFGHPVLTLFKKEEEKGKKGVVVGDGNKVDVKAGKKEIKIVHGKVRAKTEKRKVVEKKPKKKNSRKKKKAKKVVKKKRIKKKVAAKKKAKKVVKKKR